MHQFLCKTLAEFGKMQRISTSGISYHIVPPDPLEIDGLHVVGGEHARLSRPVHRPGHPALVDEGGVDDDVSVPEADLVAVLALVVVHGLVAAHLLPGDLPARWRLGCPNLGLAGRCLEGGRRRLGLADPPRIALLLVPPVLAVAVGLLPVAWLSSVVLLRGRGRARTRLLLSHLMLLLLLLLIHRLLSSLLLLLPLLLLGVLHLLRFQLLLLLLLLVEKLLLLQLLLLLLLLHHKLLLLLLLLLLVLMGGLLRRSSIGRWRLASAV